MIDITVSLYSEKLVDKMVDIYTDRYLGAMNLWELHQGWKATSLHGVDKCCIGTKQHIIDRNTTFNHNRILHAFKRQKTVFQGDLSNARIMLKILDDLSAKQAKRRRMAENTQ